MTHWLPKFTIIPANKVKNMPNCKLTVGGGGTLWTYYFNFSACSNSKQYIESGPLKLMNNLSENKFTEKCVQIFIACIRYVLIHHNLCNQHIT